MRVSCAGARVVNAPPARGLGYSEATFISMKTTEPAKKRSQSLPAPPGRRSVRGAVGRGPWAVGPCASDYQRMSAWQDVPEPPPPQTRRRSGDGPIVLSYADISSHFVCSELAGRAWFHGTMAFLESGQCGAGSALPGPVDGPGGEPAP